eukprot:CAMPEP_0114486134 /NCGR_PEP_ID=MMETSP0109-20121206/56_1 /TAXON_ID=29199 /ORGANISM="Chlorarachnion reptans, Strain CCCM449" /LENGTH=340 /DNA_ID=CAMNT_0001662283 /DNA_START=245 /DNA_END=1267 /DNA_ORIENTATION=+
MSDLAEKKLRGFLDSYTVSDLTKGKNEVFSIPNNATVETTLKELEKRKILSMPILEKKTMTYVGIVSISDIVVSICFNPAFAKLASGGSIEQLTKKDMEEIIEKSVLKDTVENLVGVTEEGKTLWTFAESESLGKLSEYFAQGVHRALVLREEGGPCFVSQWDLAKFIQTKIEKIQDKGMLDELKKPLSSLGVKTGQVFAVKNTETALAGFRRLLQWQSFRDWNLAALPIVDSKTGKILGNLSESDLRGMNEDRLLDLLFLAPMYLKTLYGEMRKPITITLDCSFKDALTKLIDSKVHRVWIVDKDEKPIGVFSLSDVVSQFSTFAKWSHQAAVNKMISG